MEKRARWKKVNWIKMLMFELRDPDGHTVWFGRSYPEDSPARARSMIERVMPELPLDDVPAGVRHCRDVLGFTVNYEQDASRGACASSASLISSVIGLTFAQTFE